MTGPQTQWVADCEGLGWRAFAEARARRDAAARRQHMARLHDRLFLGYYLAVTLAAVLFSFGVIAA